MRIEQQGAHSTRRDFLKTAGCVLAGAALSAPRLKAAADAPRNLSKAIIYQTVGLKGTVLEKFKAIQAAGFAGVEPISHLDQSEVMRAFEATGLKAASVCCYKHWKYPLSDPDPTVRQACLDALKQALRDAHCYGATSVLFVPGVVKAGITYDDCWHRSIAGIRQVLPLAEELGVRIAIENVLNDFITKPEQAVAYLDEINSPHVGWHFDIGNSMNYGPPEKWIAALGKRIVKLHFKEFSASKKFAVKFREGDNNWPTIMKALDQVGYAGWGISEQPASQAKDLAGLKDLATQLDKIFMS